MIKDYLRLVRVPNLIFIAILLWVMEKWVATPLLAHYHFGEQLPWWMLLMLIVATVLIAAGGYVINDYFDIKIDSINRNEKLIVSRSISKQQAMRLFFIVNAIGLVVGITVAALIKSISLIGIFAFSAGMLWFYSASYKRQFLVGNIVIAFLSGLTPLIIAFANIGYLEKMFGPQDNYILLVCNLYQWLGGFALFAFLSTLIREIVKDLQDQEGDRELECHTLPIVLGENWTRVVVTLLVIVEIALICYINFCIVPYEHGWSSLTTRYSVFGLIVPLACELALLWSAKMPSDYHSAQMLMKFVMFIGVLYSFVISKAL